jgi:hypothetical protein
MLHKGNQLRLREKTPRALQLSSAAHWWDYTEFGKSARRPAPDKILDLSFTSVAGEPDTWDKWHVNGSSHLHEIALRAGGTSRCLTLFRPRRTNHPESSDSKIGLPWP